jgi:hypothetical protein
MLGFFPWVGGFSRQTSFLVLTYGGEIVSLLSFINARCVTKLLKDSAGSDGTASMIKKGGRGYLGARTRQPPTCVTNASVAFFFLLFSPLPSPSS